MKKNVKSIIALIVLIALTFGLMIGANSIQTDGGKVKISDGWLSSDAGDLYYKLYTPVTATSDNKAPAVLMLHGYQNDHETSAAYAIELARRGAVVMCLDEYGHGISKPGLLSRGYVNHKVTVNYGQDSQEDGTFVEIGGQTRYKVMMNFSNLSFFDDKYTTDEDGNVLTDSSCGGIEAYAFLSTFDNVDNTRMAVSGHSMGTWSSWSVAAAYSGTDIAPKAVVLQCGELFTKDAYDEDKYQFNNVLLLQAKYDEFSYFRDYKLKVDDSLLDSDLRKEFVGSSETAKWNTTYGNFEDNSARRMELVNTNHRLMTQDDTGLNIALEWFDNSIKLPTSIDYTSHTAGTKTTLVLLAMLSALLAMFPLMNLLLGTKLFKKAVVPLPGQDTIKSHKKWIKNAVITVLIAAATFPFMTQLGHGLLPLPEGVFRMTVGNGFLSWYGILIIIMIVTTAFGRRSARKKGLDASYYSMGLATDEKPDKISFRLLGISALLVLCMTGMLYILNLICEKAFLLDLRFVWPFFKSFTAARFGQFMVYILIFALFYILNNSKIMAGLKCQATYKEGIGGFLGCWWKNALVMMGGVLVVALVEYIPFFSGMGSGVDMLFGFTFGGPFISLLILFLPQVLVFSLICTYTYRKTGNVYTGALIAAVLSCWIVTGGSSML